VIDYKNDENNYLDPGEGLMAPVGVLGLEVDELPLGTPNLLLVLPTEFLGNVELKKNILLVDRSLYLYCRYRASMHNTIRQPLWFSW